MKTSKFLVLPALIAFFLILSAKSADASYLYLKPVSQNLNINDQTQVEVKLNTQGENLNALATDISYPSDKLAVESITTAGFPILAEQTIDGDSIKLAQGSVTPINGDLTVATITFKALSAGTADLGFKSDSAAPRFVDSTDSLNLIQNQATDLNIDPSSNEAGPSATPTDATQSATPVQSQSLSFIFLYNQIIGWLNS